MHGGRDQREEQEREREALTVERACVAQAQHDVREEVDRDTAEQGEGMHTIEWIIDVGQRGLESESGEHDPGDHREVQIGIGVAGERVALVTLRRKREAPCGHERDDVEVGPPQRSGEREP